MPIRGIDLLEGLKRTSLREVQDSTLLPVYYFYGEEDFLIEICVKRIIEETLTPFAREFNLHTYYAEEVEPSSVIDSATTLPLFSSKRIVIIKGTDSFNPSQMELFIPYIRNPIPTTIMIFLGSKPDMRRGFYSIIERNKGMVEFSHPGRYYITSWIRKEVEERGKTITDRAIELLMEVAGESLRVLSKEIEKLITYLGDRKVVNEEDIKVLSPNTRTVNIFEFIDALSGGDRYRAFKSLRRLIEEGEPPSLILSLIARHFRILLMLKAFERKGYQSNEIKKRFSNIPERFLKGYLKQSRGFDEATLKGIYKRIFYADEEIKRGLMQPNDVLDFLTLDLSLILGDLPSL